MVSQLSHSAWLELHCRVDKASKAIGVIGGVVFMVVIWGLEQSTLCHEDFAQGEHGIAVPCALCLAVGRGHTATFLRVDCLIETSRGSMFLHMCTREFIS